MYKIDSYIPTRIVFGLNRLNELAELKLPGKKALICVTSDDLMKKLGFQDRVIELLAKNGVEAVVFNGVIPNPTRAGVMAASALAKESGCDFVIGLGGGSSIDTAKATAIMMLNEGDLWDYAYTGTGGRKEVTCAAPIITITTTAGTGTEADPYCVITNEDTEEKLDFACDALFPTVSIIDPDLMKSLPRELTIYQGFDALFHALECYITNRNENRLIDIYAEDAIRTVAQWLPVVVEDGSNLEARVKISYAANILCGYTQSLCTVTSHHIIAQTIGGIAPSFAHGATLIVVAEEYYKDIKRFVPELLEDIGVFMGAAPIEGDKGQNFINALTDMMDATGVRTLAMSDHKISKEDCQKITDITYDVVGIDLDKYTLTKDDIHAIVEKSYR
ncbi:iron-containing alcohol dehydrogenase [Rhodobacteraceae bacterium RKSG542]|uniref:iron-containing alcohol dehydrogenase n=1 Tax=Pseudovibrio flavus TaxID=2529854 RepID=UPI0012BB86AE|nr:iron-containing alcohol dehydrogenase [Pseudovibrio flavus]MTI15962.1 iron-containing alcohol dehydrogenase [Pseudovibrio flavus]